jgi:hypothetical protein
MQEIRPPTRPIGIGIGIGIGIENHPPRYEIREAKEKPAVNSPKTKPIEKRRL